MDKVRWIVAGNQSSQADMGPVFAKLCVFVIYYSQFSLSVESWLLRGWWFALPDEAWHC